MKKRALTILLAVFVSMAFGFLAREEMEMHKDYSGIRIANSGLAISVIMMPMVRLLPERSALA